MTKIKICGLFRPCDIEYVNIAKPDWCGFVINYPKSHRSVTSILARKLRQNLSQDIKPVGVFVDAPLEDVAQLLNDGTIEVAQLHGNEDKYYISALRDMAHECEIWKAFKLCSDADIDSINECTADMVLLDNGTGSGETFDWSLVEGVNRPYLLAGGLSPENIPTAIRQLHPYGLDISSGVETDKKKDLTKILAAVAAVRKE